MLSTKKQIYPIHYPLLYLERLGFIEPVTQTYIEIRPRILLYTLNNTTEWLPLVPLSPPAFLKDKPFKKTLSLFLMINTQDGHMIK